LEIKQQANPKRKTYKFTLDEVNAKRKECNSWEEVANFYKMSLSTLKRHKKDLENLTLIN